MRKIEMITGMDWTKHGKQKLVKEITGVKRIPVTVSPELQKLILRRVTRTQISAPPLCLIRCWKRAHELMLLIW
jgi:hypothetical protein